MSLIDTCEVKECGKKRLWFLIKKRDYRDNYGLLVKSQSRVCKTCYNNIKYLINSMK